MFVFRSQLFCNSNCVRSLFHSFILSCSTKESRKMRGALIVLEGCDRSGKTTQCKKLVDSLNNYGIAAEAMSFPDRSTAIGKVVGEYLSNKKFDLNDKAIHLLFTANRWENVNRMKKLLENGVTLIVDRYSYSGIAYSAIKPGMSLEWCKAPENGLPKPDKVFMLTLTPDVMKKRPGFGDERYENGTTQDKVLAMYRNLQDASWTIVNASGGIEDVHDCLLGDILEAVKNVKNKPIGELNFH